jgi:hypothetical protein
MAPATSPRLPTSFPSAAVIPRPPVIAAKARIQANVAPGAEAGLDPRSRGGDEKMHIH